MSIIIQNISDANAPSIGENRYLLRINQQVICEFTHHRQVDGLAQCLRDAADAVDGSREVDLDNMLRFINGSKGE